jgi:hypothetical protein
MRQKSLLFGHAIMAPEIAPIRHRYPQIINFPAKTVNHVWHVSRIYRQTKPILREPLERFCMAA